VLELRASSWAGGSLCGGGGLNDRWVVVGEWGAGAGCVGHSGGGVVFGMALCALVYDSSLEGGCRVDCRGAVFLKLCRRWGKKGFGGLICRVRG